MAKGFNKGFVSGFEVGSQIGEAISERRRAKAFRQLINDAPADLTPLERIQWAAARAVDEGVMKPSDAVDMMQKSMDAEVKRLQLQQAKELERVRKEVTDLTNSFAEAYKRGDVKAMEAALRPQIAAYNSQIIPDGRVAEYSFQDGKPVLTIKDMQTGQVVGQLEVTPSFFAVQVPRLYTARLAAVNPQLAVEFAKQPFFMGKEKEARIKSTEADTAYRQAVTQRTREILPLEKESMSADTAYKRATTRRLNELLPFEKYSMLMEADYRKAQAASALSEDKPSLLDWFDVTTKAAERLGTDDPRVLQRFFDFSARTAGLRGMVNPDLAAIREGLTKKQPSAAPPAGATMFNPSPTTTIGQMGTLSETAGRRVRPEEQPIDFFTSLF